MYIVNTMRVTRVRIERRGQLAIRITRRVKSKYEAHYCAGQIRISTVHTPVQCAGDASLAGAAGVVLMGKLSVRYDRRG